MYRIARMDSRPYSACAISSDHLSRVRGGLAVASCWADDDDDDDDNYDDDYDDDDDYYYYYYCYY